ncbi:Predicted metal-dependent peptidase [Malonomonas rubra DSM 5091]|uniref:Predicted metal-dependent peptidase n=1 Tax=Malonomonas rubra DSM 5091 TaxID=1122189 RepID=A0A1M6DWJ0_MALRU|nr:VWA-like domain-containing protein [Malonomonas rubra]SHI77606.1 Predicted metal-dependent peptidase [Malonomonas rubra DSM 5091]
MSPDRPLQDTIVRLLKRRPFYGQFLLQFRRRQQTGKRAVGVTIVDATPTLIVDPERFALFRPAEQEALLEHLLKHVLHLHPSRRKERNPRHWDLACDLAINPGIENLPPEAVQPHRFRLKEGLAAEEYYQALMQLPQLGNQDDEGSGDQQQKNAEKDSADQADETADLREAATVDDHQHWQEADRTPISLSEQVVRQMVRNAAKKCQNEIPGELEELISGFLAPPKIPWQQILRQFVGTAGRVGRTSTWKRSHRRFGHDTPGLRKQQLLNLVVGIDVSDSTDTQPLRESFANELMQIARGRQCRISVLYAGSRIQKIDKFTGNPHVAEVYRGGGFTDLRPVFDYARKMQPRPAAIIYLTDGFGPAPEQSDIPTLWVLSPDGKKPVDWGLELHLDELQE